MELQVNKSDIKNIGHTTFEIEGNTAIICSIETCNIEEILLRNILKCFGDEFEITDIEDYWYEKADGDDDVDILCITNLPYDQYMALYKAKEGDD